jgi:Cu2+-containing amine oxidase
VNYRGKRVLYRAHVPILNVLYDGNACGPYRDWQWEEGTFQANGTDVGAGFRLCPSPAQTILDSGIDQGNFRGVAIWVDGPEVVLASEMEAGWYRYVSEWRLHADGTIRPRFGFSAVQSSCVCTQHFHHAYWRFDFDIRTASNNRVREFNNPPLIGSSKWHTKSYEIKRYKDPARKRKWRVEHTQTGEAYEIRPGHDDGVADAYARGDVWVLRYRGTELDDDNNWTSAYTEADLHEFVNGEAVHDHDVVVWYAAHFTHSPADEDAGHRVGPDLVPDNW